MNSKTTNILILSSRSNIGGGGEQYIQNIVRYIDRNRFNPIVAIPDEGSLRPALEAQNVTVACLNINNGWLKPKQNWYLALSNLQDNVHRIVDFIKKNNIELVHTNSNIRWEGALAANLCGIHHIYAIRVDFDPTLHVYSHFPLQNASFAQLMTSLSSRILSVSQQCADSLSPPIPSDKIRIINNGLDSTKYDRLFSSIKPCNIRTELGIPENTPLITAAGRISPDKGFDVYLQAANAILKIHPKTHFLLAGADENKHFSDTLKRSALNQQIHEHFHFLGFRKDIAEILVESDIFVLSSRHEGQSNALLEAMACECAIIATRCSGVEDVIVDNINGILVEIGNVESLTTALTQLISQPQKRKTLAYSAREHIKRHFQIQDKVEQLMQLYDETLALPKPSAGNPAVTLLLQAAKELGTLGIHNQELEFRLRNLERLAKLITENPLMNFFRVLKKRFTV